MTNELNNDIIIVNGDPKSSFPQSVEKQSGQVFAKAKMTSLTFKTLLENILNGGIKKASSALNGKLRAVKSEIYIAEAEKTVEDVSNQNMKSLVGNAFKFDNGAIATVKKDMSSNEKITQNNVLVEKSYDVMKMTQFLPFEAFATGKKSFVYISSNGKTRGIMVPPRIVQVCFNFGKQEKLKSESIGLTLDKKSEDVRNLNPESVEKKVSKSWRDIFKKIETSALENVDDEKKENIPEKVESFSTSNSNEKKVLSDEELKDRILKGQIGDELYSIRQLQVKVGQNNQLSDGLVDRENALLQMLSKILNIPMLKQKKNKTFELDGRKTEFQRAIESIVGYREPLTEEQHREKEAEIQDYYSNPDVQKTIYDLQLKRLLFDMNGRDASEKIYAAEREDNNRRASLSEAIDLLDSSLPNSFNVSSSRKIESNNDIIKNEQKEETRILFNQNRERLQSGAEEQARILFRQNRERQQLQSGAEEQARILFRQNRERQQLQNGAEEQARILFRQNRERQQLQNGAEEQARISYGQDDNKQYTVTDIDSRYGIIDQPSKPIKINSRQLTNIRAKKIGLQISDSLIVSLKEQLDQLGLGEENSGPVLTKVA